MAVPNLTQEQAIERAALLDVDSYIVDLDLTDGAGKPGEGTFRSATTVRFSCHRPGASSWIDLVAARVPAATLNGARSISPARTRRTESRCLPWPPTTRSSSRPTAVT